MCVGLCDCVFVCVMTTGQLNPRFLLLPSPSLNTVYVRLLHFLFLSSVIWSNICLF